MGHALLRLFATVAVPVFLVGMAGSALVVLATLIRDLREVTSSDAESSKDPIAPASR